MSFRDNLQHLRATRNMTQEQLAMLVGVSRQSVTKWESERAYPEMDKLIKLSQIFECTLDDLVSGDLTNRTTEPTQVVAATASLADVCGYDEHKRSFANRVSLGVGFIVAASGASALLAGLAPQPLNQDAFAAIAMFVFVGLGLLFLLPAIFSNIAFEKAHPFIEDFYTSEQKEETRRRFGWELSAGIACILAGFGISAIHDSRLFHAAFFLLIAIGAAIIVRAALLLGRVNVEDYNIGALSELTEEETASIVGEERAAKVIAQVRRERFVGAICGIIMLVATIAGLSLMAWGAYEQNFFERFFWLAWTIGGILCAIVGIAAKLAERND